MSPPRTHHESSSDKRQAGRGRAAKAASDAVESTESVERQARKGARSSRISVESRYRSWLRHHGAMARDSARRLLVTPVASLLTMLAIAIVLVFQKNKYVRGAGYVLAGLGFFV